MLFNEVKLRRWEKLGKGAGIKERSRGGVSVKEKK